MPSTNSAVQEVDNTTTLHLHAMDNISYIRATMDRSSQFTDVPGWGLVIVGVLATLGSYIATLHLTTYWWVNTWITIGVISMGIGVVAMRLKANKVKAKLFSAPGRRFLLCFAPTIVAGMALTDLIFWELLPGMWLLMYGLAVMTAGVFSKPIVPFLGLPFFTLGIITMQLPDLFTPLIGTYTTADLFMVMGFGVCHIIYGLIIALRHGG